MIDICQTCKHVGHCEDCDTYDSVPVCYVSAPGCYVSAPGCYMDAGRGEWGSVGENGIGRTRIRMLLARWGREEVILAEMDAAWAVRDRDYQDERDTIMSGGGVAQWSETPKAVGCSDVVCTRTMRLERIGANYNQDKRLYQDRRDRFVRLCREIDRIVADMDWADQSLLALKYAEGKSIDEIARDRLIEGVYYGRATLYRREEAALDNVGKNLIISCAET